jgi:hypothetical protein
LDLVFIYRFLVLFVDLKSLVLCVYFVDRCLSFCTFSFGHCVVCSSSIYGFWWPLLHLQTLLITCLYYKDPHIMHMCVLTYITFTRSVKYILRISLRPSRPWSYGSWIYNYLCNQCYLSPLMLLVWILIKVRCTTVNTMC